MDKKTVVIVVISVLVGAAASGRIRALPVIGSKIPTL